MKLVKRGCGCLGLILVAIAIIAIVAFLSNDASVPTDINGVFNMAEGALKWATEVMRGATARLKELSSSRPSKDTKVEIEPFEPDPNSFEDGSAIEVYFAPCNPMSPWMEIDDQLIALLKNAKESIHCAFYELQLPVVAEVLTEKHKAGVKVSIVSDSEYADRPAVQSCIKAGIPVLFDGRDPFMHDKFCVVDAKYVWTGSTNITENGMYRNNNNSLRLASKELAANFNREFQEMFDSHKFGGRSPNHTPYPEVKIGSVRIECYFAPEDHACDAIVDEIHEAEKTIDFMAFSFTSDDIAEAMAGRVKQAVKVRGLFEKRCAGSQYSKDEYLAERGCSIYMDKNPYTMHHKVIIIDNDTVVTGSYNFSKQAETNNDENVLIVHDADIAAAFMKEFERLIAN